MIENIVKRFKYGTNTRNEFLAQTSHRRHKGEAKDRQGYRYPYDQAKPRTQDLWSDNKENKS